MSFSGKVKEELSRQLSSARHCQIAELAALVSMCGSVIFDGSERCVLKIQTEKITVARKCFTLVKKTFNIKADIAVRRNSVRGSVSYVVAIHRKEDAFRVLQAAKLTDEQGYSYGELHTVNQVIVQQPCCKRAFLRGAFLAAGSMSDPNKAYHFEIVCTARNMAEQLRQMMCSFSMDAKIVARKKMHVVYLKEGSQIVDMLNIMGAHVSLLELENVRVLKEMRNSVNRQVNCETANLNKTVSAAVKQVADIYDIQNTIGLDKLPEALQEIAVLRLEHQDASLKELGEMLSRPVGKSGVNHRLRKLGEIADKVRQNKEDLI